MYNNVSSSAVENNRFQLEFILSGVERLNLTNKKQQHTIMRARILEKLYDWSKIPYQRFFKQNDAWNISIKKLLKYPVGSLGNGLGKFLTKNSFDLQEKLESHDVFHVLTNTGVTVPEEISMQFYLLGNGKRSLYLFLVIVFGLLLYPDYLKLFKSTYSRGKNALPFHQLNFLKLLHQPISKIKSTFLIS